MLADPEELLLFLSADHYILNAQTFANSVRAGITTTEAGYIVTYGEVFFSSTAYGYIKQGQQLSECAGHVIARFIEKPDQEFWGR